MKKQLGIFATVLLLCTSAQIWSDVYDQDSYQEYAGDGNQEYAGDDCAPCPPPQRQMCPTRPVCRPVCPPVCPPPSPSCQPCATKPIVSVEPLCKAPARCRYPSSFEMDCVDGITVRARQPQTCMLGDQYPFDLDVHACKDVCDVFVKVHLPDGVTVMSSKPEAQVQDGDVVWRLGPMFRGECRPLKLIVRCDCEGEVCACVCATAVPVRFCSLLCAKPELVCQKCGPAEACPGDCVPYTVTITNRGSAAAEEVVLIDQVPPEMEHASGQRTLSIKLGCISPCETKKVTITLKAVKRGRACNQVSVTSCNADTTSCQACTLICKECVDCTKTGPKEVPIGKNADYTITVTNIGDKDLTDIVVTDTAPSATSIVAAEGAQINGNVAIWRLKGLRPGEKATFNLTLTTCTPGCFTNRVTVNTCQGCTANCQFTTRWKGRPALEMCPSAGEETLCVGDSTRFKVVVQNKGSEPDSNVVLSIRFPDNIKPTDVMRASQARGQIDGQTVKFGPINNFAPRQTLEFNVDAQAQRTGDGRVNVELSSDNMGSPITSQLNVIVN